MEEDFDVEESDYIKLGWENNVENCNIDEARSVMISDEPFDNEYAALEAGIIIGDLGISFNEMHSCGTWLWIEFDSPETAMAFKLRWQ